MNSPKKILLIDGNSIINRAFYGVPLLTNRDGEYTNAVYGFMNIFFKFYDEEKPDCVVVAFDVKAKTFRHLKYDDYKGGRKAMPDELVPQIPLLKNLLRKMNIQTMELAGFEADDILGTLAAKAKAAELLPVIVSGDRDLLQLAGQETLIRIPKTKAGKTETENYYEGDVLSKIGVTPQEYIDVKALMGDLSDNIPGVPGIGEKTAVKIIQEYKTLENAIAHVSEIKPKKASENIALFAEQARFSRELSEICRTVPIEADFSALSPEAMYNRDALAEIIRLEFKSMTQRFMRLSTGENNSALSSGAPDMNMVINVEEANSVVKEIMAAGLASFFSVHISDRFLGVGVTYGTAADPLAEVGRGFLLSADLGAAGEESGLKNVFFKINGGFCGSPSNSLNGNPPDSPSNSLGALSERGLCEILKPFLESDIPKITFDSKKETVFFRKRGVAVNNIVFDGSLAGYVINASKSFSDYDGIAFEYFNKSYPSLEELTGKGKNKKKPEELTAGEIYDYAVNGANVLYLAHKPMKDTISKNGQDYLYERIELPLAGVLADMELTGIKVDRNMLIEFGNMLNIRIGELQNAIYDLTGEIFNINSPSQLGVVLFEKLNLPFGKKNKTGYSTSADILEKLKFKHPSVSKILEYRTYTKLKSTYADGLLSVINPADSKIYTTFNQTGTATGRLSSSEPNLQNIPIRLELGRELRKAFVPADDSFVFMDADYSQIELRILAHMSGDTRLIEAFRNNADIHTLTASQVFGMHPDLVTSRQRSSAKAVNFGIIYGMGGFSLSEDIGITKKEADKYIEGYFKTYPQVKEFLDSVVESAKKSGYAQTIWGRKRAIPEIMSSSFFERSFGERVAMNTPVQGSAADIIKMAMVNVHKKLKENGLKSRIILQVHDELLLEVKKDERAPVKHILKDEMENCAKLSVPLVAEVHEGENWYATK